jgi:hypothetical protein
VNGRRVATRRGRRVTAPVDLRGLPRGRYRVSITVLLDNSRIVRGSRRYRTCVPRRRRPRGAAAIAVRPVRAAATAAPAVGAASTAVR